MNCSKCGFAECECSLLKLMHKHNIESYHLGGVKELLKEYCAELQTQLDHANSFMEGELMRTESDCSDPECRAHEDED